jgi:stage II sporulation protein D
MRRKKSKLKHMVMPFIIILILLGIASSISYYFFFKPGEINSGIVLDRKNTSKGIELLLGYEDKTKWIKVKEGQEIPNSIAYNVVLKGNRVASLNPCKVYTGRVLSRNTSTVELDNKTLPLDPKAYYYQLKDKQLVQKSPNSVIVGYSTYRFITGIDEKIKSVIVETPSIEGVRVGISNSNFSSLSHSTLTFYSKRGLGLKYGDFNAEIEKGDVLRVDYLDDTIDISVFTGKDNKLIKKSSLGRTKNRIYISSLSDNPISIQTLSRGGVSDNAFIPAYYGKFEVFVKDKSLKLINEVDMESYLKFVVPSEMLALGGVEGYKVQSVAARTYAISEVLNGRFAKSGFHLMDTTLSQVYNAQPSNPLCDRAIEETSSQILTYDNKIISAMYYSTSAGVGAPYNEAMKISDENTEPYLLFKDYTESGIEDLSDETAADQFLKDWTVKAYDSNSPYFRWKFKLDKKTLSTVINKNIHERYKKNPESFKKKWYLNIYRQSTIPEEGIGSINEIYISKRGKSGIIMESTIVSDTGTYRIEKESVIRNILTPRGVEYEISRIYGSSLKNPSALPSGFFTIDSLIVNDKLKEVTIYGGGYGHGVGMSQYGVIGLVRKGIDYKDILKVFYTGVDIKDYKEAIDTSIR